MVETSQDNNYIQNLVSFDFTLELLSKLESVKLYKKIIQLKAQALLNIKEGNFSNDLVYFEELKIEYKRIYHQLAILTKTDNLVSSEQVFEKVEAACTELDILRGKKGYTLSIYKRKNGHDYVKPCYIYVYYYKGQKFAATKLVFPKKKYNFKINDLMAQKRSNSNKKKFESQGRLNLNNFPYYATNVFIYEHRFFIHLLTMEAALFKLIKEQFNTLCKTDEVFLHKVNRCLISNEKPSAALEYTFEPTYWETLNKNHQFNSMIINQNKCTPKVLTNTFVLLEEVLECIKSRHQLIFKYVLASRYKEYLSGLQHGLADQHNMFIETEKSYNYVTNYKNEIDQLNDASNTLVMEDMRKTLEIFEDTHIDLKRRIRNLLFQSRLKLNSPKYF